MPYVFIFIFSVCFELVFTAHFLDRSYILPAYATYVLGQSSYKLLWYGQSSL